MLPLDDTSSPSQPSVPLGVPVSDCNSVTSFPKKDCSLICRLKSQCVLKEFQTVESSTGLQSNRAVEGLYAMKL